jgi:hypothetical protein
MIGKRTGKDLERSDLGLMHFPEELKKTAETLITATPTLSLPRMLYRYCRIAYPV